MLALRKLDFIPQQQTKYIPISLAARLATGSSRRRTRAMA